MTLQFIGKKPRAYGTALPLMVLFLAVAGCPLSKQQVRSEPEVTIGAAQDGVTEGEAVSFTVTATPAPAADLVVNVTVSETGASLGASVPQQVTIAAGLTTTTLRVETVGDDTDESDSTVTATVTAGTGYTIGSRSSARVTVADDDGASTPGPTLPPATEDLPHVTITADASRVTEGQRATFTVTANPAPVEHRVVSITVTETGATLAASMPDNVTVSAGQTTATLQVTTVDDTTDESDSTVTARVNSGTGYTVGSRSSARVTVADNDEPAPQPEPQPEPQVTIAADGDVTEGEAVSFTVAATPAPAMDLMASVTVTETGDTLAASVPDNVTVSAGQTTADAAGDHRRRHHRRVRQHRDRKGDQRNRLHGRLPEPGQGNRCRQRPTAGRKADRQHRERLAEPGDGRGGRCRLVERHSGTQGRDRGGRVHPRLGCYRTMGFRVRPRRHGQYRQLPCEGGRRGRAGSDPDLLA